MNGRTVMELDWRRFLLDEEEADRIYYETYLYGTRWENCDFQTSRVITSTNGGTVENEQKGDTN